MFAFLQFESNGISFFQAMNMPHSTRKVYFIPKFGVKNTT